MSDWSRCQWNLPDGYPAYAGYPRRRTEIRMFGRTMDPVFLQDAANALDGHGPATIVSRHGRSAIAGRRIEKDRAIGTAHHPKPSSASLQRGMPTVRVFRQRVGRRFPH